MKCPANSMGGGKNGLKSQHQTLIVFAEGADSTIDFMKLAPAVKPGTRPEDEATKGQ